MQARRELLCEMPDVEYWTLLILQGYDSEADRGETAGIQRPGLRVIRSIKLGHLTLTDDRS